MNVIGFLTWVLGLIFVLGAAMTIHEFGHFIVARMLGIRVEVFSFIGIGPRVFGWKRGHTDYRLSAIPLGAYVKLGGDESNAAIEGAGESDIPREERFDLRPKWHKFLVIVAGPVFNIATAFLVLFIGALMYGTPVAPAPVIKSVLANGAAARAGLQPGDKIAAFNGVENPTYERVRNDALISPDQALPITVERNGQRIDTTITPTKRMESGESLGLLEFTPDFGNYPVIVGSLAEGMPAAGSGLKIGDRILAINGEQVVDPDQVPELVKRFGSEGEVRLTIERGGARQDIAITPQRSADGTPRVGIAPSLEIPPQSVGLIGASVYAVNRNLEMLRLTGNALGQVFTGKRKASETVSGPIGIGRAVKRQIDDAGWAGLFSMLGFLSLNLGIVNLLPIPVLDGGAIMLLIVEAILGIVGITLSMAVRERIQQVGMVLVLMLMVFTIGNDLFKELTVFRGAGDAKPPATQGK